MSETGRLVVAHQNGDHRPRDLGPNPRCPVCTGARRVLYARAEIAPEVAAHANGDHRTDELRPQGRCPMCRAEVTSLTSAA